MTLRRVKLSKFATPTHASEAMILLVFLYTPVEFVEF
jgi:hypothetical protein